jgi:hypothetical protein
MLGLTRYYDRTGNIRNKKQATEHIEDGRESLSPTPPFTSFTASDHRKYQTGESKNGHDPIAEPKGRKAHIPSHEQERKPTVQEMAPDVIMGNTRQ